MRKSLFALLTLMLLGAAQPLWGGTVYVPYAVNKTIRGSELVTEVRIHNDSGQKRGLTYLFIPVGTDGVEGFDREIDPVALSFPPHTTTRLADLVPAGENGVLEIVADDEIAVTARLIGTVGDGAPTFGVELPVVTSTNALSPGKTAIVQYPALFSPG